MQAAASPAGPPRSSPAAARRACASRGSSPRQRLRPRRWWRPPAHRSSRRRLLGPAVLRQRVQQQAQRPRRRGLGAAAAAEVQAKVQSRGRGLARRAAPRRLLQELRRVHQAQPPRLQLRSRAPTAAMRTKPRSSWGVSRFTRTWHSSSAQRRRSLRTQSAGRRRLLRALRRGAAVALRAGAAAEKAPAVGVELAGRAVAPVGAARRQLAGQAAATSARRRQPPLRGPSPRRGLSPQEEHQPPSLQTRSSSCAGGSLRRTAWPPSRPLRAPTRARSASWVRWRSAATRCSPPPCCG